MDWIIVVVVILIFSSIFSDKKKKKRQQNAAMKQQPVAAKPVRFQDMNSVTKAAPKPAAKPTAPKPKPAKATVPKSGSLNYSGLEGEAPEEHSEHSARVLTAERLQREAAEAAQSAYEVNLEQLQNAVIMSEILNKPVSLRRNGCRG